MGFIQRLQTKFSFGKKQKGTYGAFSSYVFSTNHLLGVGILGLSYDFYHSGLLLSILFLILITPICISTMMYLIQCSARTEAFENSLHKIDPKKKITTIAKEDLCSLLKDPNPYLSQSPNSTHESQIEEDSTSEEKYDGLLMENDPLIEKKKNTIMINVEKNHAHPSFVLTKKYEIQDMCNLYLGKIGRNAYFINLVVFLLLTVMSYSAVFGSSLSTLFPIKSITKGDSCIIDEKFTSNCQHNYLVYVCIYACIVVPFSCLDLPEQKIIQILLCLFRFLSIGAIIVTTLVGIYRPNSQQDNNDPPHIAPGSKLFKLNGLYLIFTASIFVQVIHHSVTIISEGIPDKSKLRFSFTSSLTTTLLLYTLVGTVCSLYFGKNTKTVITLNWLDYTANYKNTPVWASIIKYIIILFPMLDLISIFPLKIVTLGTGMQSFFYPQTIGKTDLKSKLIKIAFRLVSSLPPIIGSMFVKKLPLIIFFIGITGCFIGFIFPSLLQYKSGKLSKQIYNTDKTPYSDFSSSDKFSISFCIFGVFCLICSMCSSIYSTVIEHEN